MLFFYLIYSVALWFWTNNSIQGYDATCRVSYVFLVAGFMVCSFLVFALWRKDKAVSTGIFVALILANMGASIAYRTSEIALNGYLEDFKIMAIAFLIVYVVIRFTTIYQMTVLNWICIGSLPLILLITRFTDDVNGGAYLEFFGLQIFGLVLIGYPFVAAHFMAMPQNRYLFKNVRSLPVNLLSLLSYTFVLFVGCGICNEFGLLLVVALSTTVIFFLRCRNWKTKVLYSVLCMAGAFLVTLVASHVNDRVEIWLNLKAAAENPHLATKAETVLYLFRNFLRMGWYGNGIGNLSPAYYKTLNNDHIVVTLLNDYGAIITILVLAVGILFVKWMLYEKGSLNLYDRYLNITCALIVGFIMLLHVASNLGSFVTAGVGFPWVSDGGTTNLMFTVMLAIHCGINKKEGADYEDFCENEETDEW